METLQHSEEALNLQKKVNDLFLLKRLISSLPNLPSGKFKESVEYQIAEYLQQDLICYPLNEEANRLSLKIADKQLELDELIDNIQSFHFDAEERVRTRRSREDSRFFRRLLLGCSVLMNIFLMWKLMGAS